MPRRPHKPEPSSPPPPVHVIEPNGVYFVDSARRALRLTKETMREEVRNGRLRVAVCAKRYYIKGAWLLDWLDALPPARRRQTLGDPSLSPALRRAMAAASRLDAGERAALRAWLDGRAAPGNNDRRQTPGDGENARPRRARAARPERSPP